MNADVKVRERDFGIDVLKFLAVVLVVNSHMDICYHGKWVVFATGGAIGDALFFFCSGYTLFLGREDGFICWYKRRMWRILPSLFLCFLLAVLFYGGDFWDRTGDGFWFVRLILVFYVLLYAIRKLFFNRMWIPCIGIAVIISGWFLFFYDWRNSVLGYSYFMRAQYFIPMLMGAVVGCNRDRLKNYNGWGAVVLLFAMLVGFYGFQILARKYVALSWMQLLVIACLNLLVYLIWKVAELPTVCCGIRRALGSVITAVGGLCLEVYLCHRPFLTDALNGWFPLNIPVLFAAILMLAYAVRCVTRFIVQTLQWSGNYDWRAIVKVV